MRRKDNPVYLFWKILWAFSLGTGFFALIVGFFSLNTGLTGLTPPMTYAVFAFLSCFAVPLYTLPAFLAYRNAKPRRKRLLILNVFLGWTVAGWLIALYKASGKGGESRGSDR